jgi:hypothetical protein
MIVQAQDFGLCLITCLGNHISTVFDTESKKADVEFPGLDEAIDFHPGMETVLNIELNFLSEHEVPKPSTVLNKNG